MPTQHDILAPDLRLPPEIKRNLQALIVDRNGKTQDSFMRTEQIIGHIQPGEICRLNRDSITPAPGARPAEMPKATIPPYAVLDGEWDSEIDFVLEKANILGGNGCYLLPESQQELAIPEAEATPEQLAFYGSRLIRVGDVFRFEADAPLPVTKVSVGRTYVADFLMNAEIGGGEFLEVHDRPHFHMPLDQDAKGYLIIGKTEPDGVRKISAFRIPYGFGIMMPPWVIHADSHLIGRFLVVYSVTEKFSTVTIRKSDGALARISVF